MLRVGVYASTAIAQVGLLALLQTAAIEVVAAVDNLDAVQTLLELPTVDAVVLEVPELEESIVQRLRMLLGGSTDGGANPELPGCLIITTATELPGTVPIAVVLAAGVRGVLPHTVTAEEVESAIAAVASGLTVLHPVFGDRLWPDTPIPASSSKGAGPLSDRELQVLDALSLGLSNKQIASRFYISEHTVKFHISSILAKLQVSGRTEAVAAGIRQGFIKL